MMELSSSTNSTVSKLDELIENDDNSRRSCKTCKVWLKEKWNGETCSKCIWKTKYKKKVINTINYKFRDKTDINPFVNGTDFEDLTVDRRLKLAKFVGIYTGDNNDDNILLRLKSFQTELSGI